MNMNEGRGHYLGTEINERWWRRYTKDGLLARGNGDYWIDTFAFYFRRYLTEVPIVISFRDVIEVKIGKWHSGRRVYGMPVVKIVWRNAGTRLSSGFAFPHDVPKIEALVQQIRSHVGEQAASSSWHAHAAGAAKQRN